MKKYLAEFIGTLALVLIGCGTAVVAGPQVGIIGISFAFGLTLTAMAYGIGPISGCHINPAVSLAFFIAGRINLTDLGGYVIAQFLGGLMGAAILLTMASGHAGYELSISGLGQNGWGAGYLGEYNQSAAMLFEFVGSFLFITVILGSTQKQAPTQVAGVAIGLTLVVMHLFGINITGVSLNPARSLGPAMLVGGKALSQVWLFILVPSIAGVLSGLAFRSKLFEEELPSTEATKQVYTA